MLSPPDSPRGLLLSQYVCARITRLDRVDLGVFDWDRHNTLYYFALNADEQIYLRYGGRDSLAPDSYLSLDSIDLALAHGLELHRRYRAGELPKTERPKPIFVRDYPLLVKRTVGTGACVECHLVSDFQNQHRKLDGTFDPVRDMYRSPDINTVGIHLDVPKGLLVEEAQGPAAEAGMRAGDTISAVNGTPVWTFGDLQYRYDKVDRQARQVELTVDRAGQPISLSVSLPEYWWLTDLRFRHWSMEPRVYFESKPLSSERKKELGLNPAGFASEIGIVDSVAELLNAHQLKKGDIIYAVDGVDTDELANTAELYIKLRRSPDDTMKLAVIRDGERLEQVLKPAQLNFRK